MAGEVLRHFSQKPATVLYPEVKVEMPRDFRGKIRFHAARCVGCKLCQKDCPACAIEIEKVGEKRFQAVFHLDRCIFCAQCVDSCNKDALEATTEYELATLDRSTLRVVYAPEAPPREPEAAPGPTGEPAATAGPPAAAGGGASATKPPPGAGAP
jgi:formate hydrogenlyase subunit 6/NADH:ubiquinone oxidoreductase subunit I